ncbi:MAG TPA: type IV pilus secretin PilQ [Candidatus Acidoferrum sp.]|nr:type IV pilus secretin PilQ [Candidatus Acidoferrum sp.]
MITNWPALRNGCLILASVAFGSLPTLAQTQEPAGPSATASVISSVAITQGAQRSSVRVEGEGHLDARTLRMQNPDRLVLDFSGARLAVQKTMIPGVSAPVRGVRLGQYRPDVVRVVIDLSETTPYQIGRDGNALVVLFDAQPATPVNLGAKTITSDAHATPASYKFAAAAPRAVSPKSKNVQISAPRFALPSELTQPSVALASYAERREPARPDGNSASQQAAQQANAAATTVSGISGSQLSAPAAKYTGEPISVNLKDVDLRDFFRLIHEISGLNVVLDPAVKGSLTIVLDEVPWDQALDIVLQNNGLDKQLNGNVLRIATHETMKKEAEAVRDLEKAQSDAVPPVTVTRVLSYTKASAMTGTLKRFLSSRGEVFADERSNQLIIRDIPQVIPVIDNLLHQLDRKSQQVEIEARVVSASRTFAQDIGTELGFSGSTTHGRSLAFGGQGGSSGVTTGAGIPPGPGVTVSNSGSGSSSTPTGLPLAVSLGAGVPTSGIGFSHRSPNFAVDFFITAAEARGVGKLLSKPRVVTQNNEKAVVKQGTKIPVQTTINNTISITFIDAVLKLEVTPQITAEGTVFMDVLVENTQIDQGIPRVQGTPALDTQSAETKVLVDDGGTVVIGGIIISSQRVDVSQVPIVGSLPLIGHLFKRTNINNQSQELLFFLTPRILPS